jgi:serine/threonine protein kinase
MRIASRTSAPWRFADRAIRWRLRLHSENPLYRSLFASDRVNLAESLMPLSVSDRLGPYEILAPIGCGGMGEVYRARGTKMKLDAAIKGYRLPEAFARDPWRAWWAPPGWFYETRSRRRNLQPALCSIFSRYTGSFVIRSLGRYMYRCCIPSSRHDLLRDGIPSIARYLWVNLPGTMCSRSWLFSAHSASMMRSSRGG